MEMKILAVIGTRPEAIKMAPVIVEMKRRANQTGIRPLVCVTGQHREMLDQVLNLFNVAPDYDLSIMRENQTLSQIASAVIQRLEPILVQEKPDWVLVQGDTTTAMAAALAAFYARVRVGHIEAGLRTYDKLQPFPEEINRRTTSVIADAHFAATEQAIDNLISERINKQTVLLTGNTVIDALLWVSNLPYDWNSFILAETATWNSKARVLLVTAHRRENFGRPLENICNALRDLALQYGDEIHIIYPVHLNPHVQQVVLQHLSNIPNITLLSPLDYLTLVNLMKHSYLVLTDSGGLQEEAPALGKPVLVLREVTERPEAVAAGMARVVGTDSQCIFENVTNLLSRPEEYAKMARKGSPYGDGKAAERIVKFLLGESVDNFSFDLSSGLTNAVSSFYSTHTKLGE